MASCDYDATSESGANGAISYADGDGCARDRSGAGGRAYGGANGGECGRGTFNDRGNKEGIRVYAIRPSYSRRAAPEKVAPTEGSAPLMANVGSS
jgi:hypothetical protein